MSFQTQPYLHVQLPNGLELCSHSSVNTPHVLDIPWLSPNDLPDSRSLARSLDYIYHYRTIKDCIATLVYDYDEEVLQGLIDYEHVNNFLFKLEWRGWSVGIMRYGNSVQIHHTSYAGPWCNIHYEIDDAGEWHGIANFRSLSLKTNSAFDWCLFFQERRFSRECLDVDFRYDVKGFIIRGGQSSRVGATRYRR